MIIILLHIKYFTHDRFWAILPAAYCSLWGNGIKLWMLNFFFVITINKILVLLDYYYITSSDDENRRQNRLACDSFLIRKKNIPIFCVSAENKMNQSIGHLLDNFTPKTVTRPEKKIHWRSLARFRYFYVCLCVEG